MSSIYGSPPQYSFAPLTPPTTPPPFESHSPLTSNNPFLRNSPKSEKMSFFGSIKDKFSKRSSNNPFQNDSKTTPSEPPPAYTSSPGDVPNFSGRHGSRLFPPTSHRGASPTPSVISRASVTTDDDQYAFLTTFDTVFVIDDSGSMYGSNWEEVRNVLKSIVPICTARDKDGIDVYFLNHKSGRKGGPGKADGGYYNITDPSTVTDLFNRVRPTSMTPTGIRLQSLLKPYADQLSANSANQDLVKPINIIVITDGRPTDDVESVIVQHASKLDKLESPLYQVGIQFFQVGKDPGAYKALKELDDGLVEYGVRDMVDTCSWDPNSRTARKHLNADEILKVVLGAVVRRIDRQTS